MLLLSKAAGLAPLSLELRIRYCSNLFTTLALLPVWLPTRLRIVPYDRGGRYFVFGVIDNQDRRPDSSFPLCPL